MSVLYVKKQVNCLFVLLTGEIFLLRAGADCFIFTKYLDNFKKILTSML